MVQAVTRRHPIDEAQVWAQTSPCGICGGQSGGGQVLLRARWFSPANTPPTFNTYSYHWCYIILATDSVVKLYTNTHSQYDNRNVPSPVTTTPAQGSHECNGVLQTQHAFAMSSRHHYAVSNT
jgi:hypothetical protein